MRKKIVIPYILTIGFLISVVVIGAFATHLQYSKYGWMYDRVIIEGGYMKTETVNLGANVFSLGVFAWITILLGYSLRMEKDLETKQSPYS